MIRQFICRGLILGRVVVGVDGLRNAALVGSPRRQQDDVDEDDDDPANPKAVASDASKLNSVDSTDKNSQPFFSRTRNRSAWSSFSPEAQQIEKDLGVY